MDAEFVAGAAGHDPAALALALVSLALVVRAGPELGHLRLVVLVVLAVLALVSLALVVLVGPKIGHLGLFGHSLAVLALVVLALVVLAGPEIGHLGYFQCCLQQI
ncbi:hypothetical protein F5887DRAFT_1071646 [Amanita rubescens]|nr:hypothetical protein F5887DRAFT_1071646 [Amanita rubescens]